MIVTSFHPLVLSIAFASAIHAFSTRAQTETERLATCLIDAEIAYVSAERSQASAYYSASASDNVVYHYNPLAIVYPADAAQVQAAVRCGMNGSNIAIAARSGGHSFAGYGSGGMDGSFVIDLVNMSSINVNSQQGTVEIQPAARLGDVVKELWRVGKRAMPTGTCPSVGIGGLSLCGGVGPMSRKWGLTTDNILEADLILANGTLVTVSRADDIMWALRGAGSFFGIVTRFVFQTYDVRKPVSYFNYRWVSSLVDVDTATRLIMAIQAFAMHDDLPNELGFHIQIKRPPHSRGLLEHKISIDVKGSYLGPLATLKRLKRKLLRQLKLRSAPMPDAVHDFEDNYFNLMKVWDDFGRPDDKLNTQAEHKVHNNFVTKSVLTLDHRKGFTYEAFRPVLQLLWDQNQDDITQDGHSAYWAWNVFLEFFGGADPFYRREEMRKTSSLAHRDGLWLIQAAVGTLPTLTLAPSGHAFASRIDAHITKAITESGLQRGGYSCYVDSDLHKEEWTQLYYGPSLSRLEDVKMSLDPSNVFRNPQTLGNKQSIMARRTAS